MGATELPMTSYPRLCTIGCPLSNYIHTGQTDEFIAVLHRFVFKHFSISNKDPLPEASSSEQWPPWVLFAAVFTGCPEAVEFCLRRDVTVQDGLDCKSPTSPNGCGVQKKRPSISSWPENWASGNGSPTRSSISSLSDDLGNGPLSPKRSSVSFLSESLENGQKSLEDSTTCCYQDNLLKGRGSPNQSSTPTDSDEIMKIQFPSIGVNSRIACNFPMEDSWVRQSVKLLMTPLHVACWRLDAHMIKLLLCHGADPNTLALEEVPDDIPRKLKKRCLKRSAHQDPLKMLIPEDNEESEDTFQFEDGFYFFKNRGFDSFYFVDLGVQSPPSYSILDGLRRGLIHDAAKQFGNSHDSYWERKSGKYFLNKWTAWEKYSVDDQRDSINSLAPPLIQMPWFTTKQEKLMKDVQRQKQEEICVELLVTAGCDPESEKDSDDDLSDDSTNCEDNIVD